MRQDVIRLIACWMVASAIPLSAGTRSAHQLSCKRVRDAVWAGHTLDQLTAEFDTDAEHIMKCLQSGKGKKPSAAKKGKKAAKKKPAAKKEKKSAKKKPAPASKPQQ
jgi:hypothetical protein